MINYYAVGFADLTTSNLEPAHNLFLRSPMLLVTKQSATAPNGAIWAPFLRLSHLFDSPETVMTYRKKIINRCLGCMMRNIKRSPGDEV